MDPNDSRWTELKGRDGVAFDPRPALRKLKDGSDVEAAWQDLWRGLHHQGDVGEASYASVPQLVGIHRHRGVPDWNTYAIVATIELARDRGGNPPMPPWLRADYMSAIAELAELALRELPRATDLETVRSMLSVLAIWKGARTYGRILVEFTTDEIEELDQQARGGGGEAG